MTDSGYVPLTQPDAAAARRLLLDRIAAGTEQPRRRSSRKTGNPRADRAKGAPRAKTDKRCAGPCSSNRPITSFAILGTSPGGPVRSDLCRMCAASA